MSAPEKSGFFFSFFYFNLVLTGLRRALLTRSKPWCLTPISTTTEEWWPTSLCLEVGSGKATGSCRRISTKPTRSTSWGCCGRMSSRRKLCMWHPSTSTLISTTVNHQGLGCCFFYIFRMSYQKKGIYFYCSFTISDISNQVVKSTSC